MMKQKTMSVRPVPGRMVPDTAALVRGCASFVGWRKGDNGFEMSDKPVTVPVCPEYTKALRKGDLKPADDATARVAGVKVSVQ